MKANKIYTVLFCFLLFSAVSCVKEEPAIMDEDGLLRVPVSLNLSVDALIDGTPETKATMDPDLDENMEDDDQIKNIVVLQFNGTNSSARLVGGQAYFDHWPLNGYRETTDPLYDVNDKLTLVASATANTVVVLANTFDRVPISSGTTLGDFLQQDFTTISNLSGVLTTSGENDYFRLSGSQYLARVDGVTNVEIALKRNVAKIVVNVTNNTSGDNAVSISKVHLRSINAKYYYLTHIGEYINVEFTDPYSEAYPNRFDNDQEDFTGTTQAYTYYVPANLRGTTDNAYQYNKGNGAPAGATLFRLYGTYGASNTPIVYTYYLGGNLTNDFNIRPNYKYTYNITINTKGDFHYDYRIEDMAEITFGTDANCYMLHPPASEGMSRVYKIPVRRAAVFWNAEGVNSGVYGASTTLAGYGSYVWDGSTNWTAEVLWSDFDLSGYTGDDSFLVSGYSSGTGFDPTNPAHTKPHFKVKVKSGMKGNVVVGVKVNGVIMWSWHFWVTEYNPDQYAVPVSGKYIYAVKEGYIHRFNNSLFNSTEATDDVVGYKNGFIMDRNLGAIGSTVNSYISRGLYYQWGRKDPFAWGTATGAENRFYLGGTSNTTVLSYGQDDPGLRIVLNNSSYLPITDSYKNIRYSVTHPMVYIRGRNENWNWTVSDDDLGDTGSGKRWNDKKFWQHKNGNQAVLELKKSIYDPCPPGWKLPVNGIWGGFNYPVAATEETGTYTTNWGDGGRYYYPEGYVNASSTGAIYFPASGMRKQSNGGIDSVNSGGFYWSVTASTGTNSDAMYFGTTYIYTGGYNKTIGLPVRCVRE